MPSSNPIPDLTLRPSKDLASDPRLHGLVPPGSPNPSSRPRSMGLIARKEERTDVLRAFCHLTSVVWHPIPRFMGLFARKKFPPEMPRAFLTSVARHLASAPWARFAGFAEPVVAAPFHGVNCPKKAWARMPRSNLIPDPPHTELVEGWHLIPDLSLHEFVLHGHEGGVAAGGGGVDRKGVLGASPGASGLQGMDERVGRAARRGGPGMVDFHGLRIPVAKPIAKSPRRLLIMQWSLASPDRSARSLEPAISSSPALALPGLSQEQLFLQEVRKAGVDPRRSLLRPALGSKRYRSSSPVRGPAAPTPPP